MNKNILYTIALLLGWNHNIHAQFFQNSLNDSISIIKQPYVSSKNKICDSLIFNSNNEDHIRFAKVTFNAKGFNIVFITFIDSVGGYNVSKVTSNNKSLESAIIAPESLEKIQWDTSFDFTENDTGCYFCESKKESFIEREGAIFYIFQKNDQICQLISFDNSAKYALYYIEHKLYFNKSILRRFF